MSPSQAATWYLLKHDDASVFGPMQFAQLALWAKTAQISPLDKVSPDLSHWVRAPMVPELEMDWLIEVSAEYCYGPTTAGAIQDFLDRDEIDLETVLINARDGTTQRIGDLAIFTQPEDLEEDLAAPPTAATGGEQASVAGEEPGPREPGRRQSLHARIRELEHSLLEERRLLSELHARYNQLEAKYVRLLGHQTATMRFDD
ncbi:MAG: hypothetical protein JO117_06235 [Verrucomicrobia bacterium]|nr:hypothetical protein [Verrucomicrobiota bacterium]MBV9657859.1 hypothetical protein [Verrucomicrobiota bacterium]